MIQRKASAKWEKGLKSGNGTVQSGSGAVKAGYNFGQRFENEPGTNPDELLGAAHAACFAMALSADLERAGYAPESVSTEDIVHLEQKDGGFAITTIEINTTANVPGIDNEAFQKVAQGTKDNCPVSKALKGVEFKLNAKLNS